MKKGIDYIGVGVGAVISDDEGKYFLAKRGAGARNEAETWEFPGGGVELGDGLEDTIIREIREEYDINIRVDSFLCVFNHLIPDEHQHWVGLTYSCSIISGSPKICEPEKCDDIGWFTLEEMKTMNLSLISVHDREILLSRGEK